jgi:regulator of sirC expression with transglutaminase-like and TPR domain
VDAYPKYAAAWYELGRTQQHGNDLEGARKSYAQALAADPKFVSPYEQLAQMAVNDKKWQEAADDTSRLLKLNPVDFPQAWFYNSLANYQLQKLDAAEKSVREGLQVDSAHHFPKMNHLLAVILAQKQDYQGAAENMRAYLKLVPNASDADTVKKQLAEVEKLAEPQAKKE